MTPALINTADARPRFVDKVSTPATTDAQQSFLSILGKHSPDQRVRSAPEQAREAAERFVSMTLVQPLLKQLRSSNTAAPPFAPTQAEKQFRALMDADLAQRIVHARQFPLVDTLAHRLLERGGKDAFGRSISDEASNSLPQTSAQPSVGVNTLAR